MPEADGPISEAPPAPVNSAERNVVLIHLRTAKKTLRWSLITTCIGFLVGLAAGLAFEISMGSRAMDTIAGPLVLMAITSLVLMVTGLLGAAAAGIAWFLIVYFGYTRFSLRTLILSVWVFAGILTLVAAGNEQLRAIGIPLLIVFVIVLVARIAANDPLASPGLKEFIAPEEQAKPPGEKQSA
jgi:hypothetical protein